MRASRPATAPAWWLPNTTTPAATGSPAMPMPTPGSKCGTAASTAGCCWRRRPRAGCPPAASMAASAGRSMPGGWRSGGSPGPGRRWTCGPRSSTWPTRSLRRSSCWASASPADCSPPCCDGGSGASDSIRVASECGKCGSRSNRDSPAAGSIAKTPRRCPTSPIGSPMPAGPTRRPGYGRWCGCDTARCRPIRPPRLRVGTSCARRTEQRRRRCGVVR